MISKEAEKAARKFIKTRIKPVNHAIGVISYPGDELTIKVDGDSSTNYSGIVSQIYLIDGKWKLHEGMQQSPRNEHERNFLKEIRQIVAFLNGDDMTIKKNPTYRGQYPLKVKTVASSKGVLYVTLNNGDKFKAPPGEIPAVGKAMNSEVLRAYAESKHSVKKNPGPKRKPKQLSYGDNIRYNTKDGFGPGTIINPHVNIAEYSHTEGGREYNKKGFRHIRQVEILTSRNKPKIVMEYEIDGMPEMPKAGNPRLSKNPIIPGITARPVKGNRKPVFAVEYGNAKTGPWNTAGIFANRTLADDYCQGMHESNPAKWWRVVLK